MTTVITIYGKPFSIGFSEGDGERRSAYFKSGTGNLTPQEKSLLLSLGVDAILENSLKPYLAEFFSSLQTCSSDASLVLSKSCETAYFVIWSALFHNRAEIERRMKAQKGEVVSDIDLAQDAAIISGLKSRPLEKTRITGISEEEQIRRLFTLMVVGEAGSIPVNSTDDIDRLFTLMVLGDEESSNGGSNAGAS
jgi:hypothetical protein